MLKNHHIKRNRVSEDEVEELVKKGQTHDNRVGMFVLNIVGSHRSINNTTAKRFLLTYDELVNDGAFFVIKYIKNFNSNRARLSTYVYQSIKSFLQNLHKKHYGVQRRIPPNKLYSYDKLARKTETINRSALSDYRSIETMFVRVCNWLSSRLHDIELQEIEMKIIVESLIQKTDHLSKVKKVLELLYVGHDYNSIVTKIGKHEFKEYEKEIQDNIEFLENIGVSDEILPKTHKQ